jgi:hypothetical protein
VDSEADSEADSEEDSEADSLMIDSETEILSTIEDPELTEEEALPEVDQNIKIK